MIITISSTRLEVIGFGSVPASVNKSREMARYILELQTQSPVAWTDAEELREMERDGYGAMLSVINKLPSTDPRRQIMFYRAPILQPCANPVDFRENAGADICREQAWKYLKEQLTPDGWTVGDNITYFGFFCWGWDMRRQYNEQRTVPQADKDGDA